MKYVSLIIPSYHPDEKLVRTVRSMSDVGFEDIILVNDGSGEGYDSFFEECAKIPGVTLLTHEVNRGKGAALKTAIAYIRDNRPDSEGAVTADGDGQHFAQDVLACADMMLENEGTVVLGVRNFDGDDVPARSRFGNRMTSFIFRTGVGLKVSDTQTGLRALPAEYYDVFLQTRGDRYEYETNMLLDIKAHDIPMKECRIQTIYIDENATSHFHPVRDSIRIYGQILRFCLSSGLSTLLDYLVFLLLSYLLLGRVGDSLRITLATVGARAVSSVCNCLLNRAFVFRSGESKTKVLLRYYCLAIPQMCLSALLVNLISTLLGNAMPLVTALIKIVVDTLLFFASYTIQQNWVFRSSGKKA